MRPVSVMPQRRRTIITIFVHQKHDFCFEVFPLITGNYDIKRGILSVRFDLIIHIRTQNGQVILFEGKKPYDRQPKR